ncbi:MAG: cytochrome c oxidase subunit II [Polyangia bacterium]|jgi:cytochrome c oxidase subunit 2
MKRSRFKLATHAAYVSAFLTLIAASRVWADPPTTWGRPFDASLDGNKIDWLFKFTTIAIGILFVIMAAILIWATVMQRDTGGRKAQYEHGIGRKHLLLTALVSSIIFFGVDGTLLYSSFVDLTETFWKWPTAKDHPVEVEVYAQQWVWNFRLAGPDGKFNTPDDVVTINDLHLPVNTPVFVKIKSKDVIHSFYLPNMRIKQDAFPGSITQLWFEPTKPGQYVVGCAQHCGVSHYKMHGTMTVESQQEYERWLHDESTAAKRRFDQADSDAHWGWDWEI